MYILLLHLLIIISIFVSLFILFGGIVDPEYAKLNIYVFIPLIVIINILPFDILLSCKQYVADKCINNYPIYENKSIDEVINENSNIYILPNIHNKIYNSYHYFNPVDYQGLLILGYIINIYSLKYIWNNL